MFEGVEILGHDDGGIISSLLRIVTDAEECAQACLNDRCCNSFEFGVSGDTIGHCRLSYDTQSTVNASLLMQASITNIPVQNVLVQTPLWQYYESTNPVNPLVAFQAPLANTWLPGVNDVGKYTNVTLEACAALCVHNAGCRSFEFSAHGPECSDR